VPSIPLAPPLRSRGLGGDHGAVVRRLEEAEAGTAQEHAPGDVEGRGVRRQGRERSQPEREDDKADAAQEAGRIAVCEASGQWRDWSHHGSSTLPDLDAAA
jgi:hypothetical protein